MHIGGNSFVRLTHGSRSTVWILQEARNLLYNSVHVETILDCTITCVQSESAYMYVHIHSASTSVHKGQHEVATAEYAIYSSWNIFMLLTINFWLPGWLLWLSVLICVFDSAGGFVHRWE